MSDFDLDEKYKFIQLQIQAKEAAILDLQNEISAKKEAAIPFLGQILFDE